MYTEISCPRCSTVLGVALTAQIDKARIFTGAARTPTATFVANGLDRAGFRCLSCKAVADKATSDARAAFHTSTR
jgi:phage FluMu protein Com